MTEPTQEQIKEFWEWCGLRYECYDTPAFPNMGGAWIDTDDKLTNTEDPCEPPPIDLNSLFKYAVPFVQDKGYMIELYSYEHKGYKVKVYNIIGQVDIPIVITKDDDPALALFWALYKVMEASK